MTENLSMEEDHLLLSAFQKEELKDWAFTQLVSKYQERLYWHIRRMVLEHEDTNDILQNVFIKVWKNLGNFREEALLFTWLYRIASNESLNWLEKQKKNSSFSLNDHQSLLEEKLVAQKGFDVNKIEWRLQQAIQSLPEKQRLVFNLRYFDEMPYEKMSVILETSVGALKASYHHAVKKIEAILIEA